MLQKDLGEPLHLQLSNLIRQQIQAQELSQNHPLPSERELCEKYGVSRITVRQAMADLKADGLIYSVAGKGSYVASACLEEEFRPLSSFTEELGRRDIAVTSRIIEASILNANEEQSTRLKIPRGAEVVHLYRLRIGNGLPIALQLALLPHHLCPGLLKFDLAKRSLFDVLRREYRLKMTRADTSISAGTCNSHESEWLQMTATAAVLITRQTTYLEDDKIIEYTQSIFRSDRYTITINTCS